MQEKNQSVDGSVYPYYEYREFWFSKESIQKYREQHGNRWAVARQKLRENQAANMPLLVCMDPVFRFAYETRLTIRILIYPTLKNAAIPKNENNFSFSSVMIRDFLLVYVEAVKAVCDLMKPTDYLSVETIERCYRLAAKVKMKAEIIGDELVRLPLLKEHPVLFAAYKEQVVLLARFLKASKPLEDLFNELWRIVPDIQRRHSTQQTPPPQHPSKSSDTKWIPTTKAEFDKLLKKLGYPTRQTCAKHQGEPGFPEIEYAQGEGKNRMMQYRFLERLESPKKSIE